MSTYTGEIDIQDGAFSLDADRFVIRDGEIAFMLSGSDGDGDFTAEGIAKLTSGIYVASQVMVVYSGFVSKDYATIQFDDIVLTPKKLKCKVTGSWTQSAYSSPFSGNLSKFK